MFVKREIEFIITQALRQKMQNYNPEPAHKPFHTRLLGEDRMALFSFIHSLNTSFGTAIFERVAEQIATGVFDTVSLQHRLSGVLSADAQSVITKIMNDLSAGKRDPNHEDEISKMRKVSQSGNRVEKRMRRADIFLVKDQVKYLLDLKTTKPNVSGFEKHKQDMLEWAATILYDDPQADVRICIAMPYNPYEPEPYKRWTLRGMLEIQNQSQLMVGPEFWNFLAGGTEIYEELLDCFENVGIAMRKEIDEYFKKFVTR